MEKQPKKSINQGALPMTVGGHALTLVLKLLRTLFLLLPLQVALRFFAWLGSLAYYACPRENQISAAQMNWVKVATQDRSPNFTKQLEDPRKLCKNIYRHLGRAIGEICVLHTLANPKKHFVKGTGQEHVEKILASGQGALAISAHLGCIELLAAYHIQMGVPLSVVARQPNYRFLSDWLTNVRASYGVNTIWREDERGPRKVIQALKSGLFVAALIDQDTALESTYADFFELEAAYPVSLIQLAVRIPVPIVSSFIVRRSETQHEVISEPIEYDPQDKNAVLGILNTFGRRLENLIAEHPDQWIWWHRRWRRRPGIDYTEHPEKLPSTSQYISWLNTQAGLRHELSADT